VAKQVNKVSVFKIAENLTKQAQSIKIVINQTINHWNCTQYLQIF